MDKEYLERLNKKIQKALMRAVWPKNSTNPRTDDAMKLWTLYATIAGALAQKDCCVEEEIPTGDCCVPEEEAE